MKATIAFSALASSVLAAPFQLVVSKAANSVDELKDKTIAFQHSVLLVADNVRYGVRRQRHTVHPERNSSDGLTTGFTTARDNTIKFGVEKTYAQGTFEGATLSSPGGLLLSVLALLLHWTVLGVTLACQMTISTGQEIPAEGGGQQNKSGGISLSRK
ncbi:hypothetical protein BU24DRAFT_410177 [Aaosphaeria arxii CBS 175.79]|uniref:Uncharacterized protein n=1 Tax=Aaosphaeria arxii CBS 175.79 TaxID=1450172 RepID=A0A6A5XNT8_9PLEO|nr:uncharacterized protein BU24DRAFT_410177 [Aaosphaeria arxii CBS 175.79]KAF2014431.1 hypothetical protein BU24DRAFT_410177 [Aaosphaeria arxii CBS 175.79]